MNKVCVPLNPKSSLLFNKVSRFLDNGMVGDITEARNLFIYVALIALGASLIFLILTCCCTGFITWVMIAALGVVFILFGSLIFVNYFYTGPLNDGMNSIRVKYLDFMMRHKVILMVLAVVCILIGLFVFFFMIKFGKYIKTAIPLLSYASKSTLTNILLIVLSVVIIFVQIFVFLFELYVMLRIYVTGEEIENKEEGSPFVQYSVGFVNGFLIFFHFFGMYWLIVSLNNFNDYVCAAVTVNFYYKSNIANIRIFCHVLGHNVGTVAWSIVLLPALLFKLVFGLFDYCLTSDNPNAIQRFFNKICCCCIGIYENTVDSISENYFPVSYLGSVGFWRATRTYYYLSEKYHDETSTVIMIGSLFSLVGKLLIAFLSLWCGYLIYKSSIEYQ